jgi:hypothetical protein
MLPPAASARLCVVDHRIFRWVCSNCVRRNIEVNVTDGDLQRLCPVCNGDFSEDFIREHSSDDLFQKYTRFKINKSNPNMRTCSKCNVLSEGR